jgi:carboxypeptidase Taq
MGLIMYFNEKNTTPLYNPNMMRHDYLRFLEKAKEIKILKTLSMLVDWDQETYMPTKGLELRSMQKAYIETLAHKEFTSTATEELLGNLIDLTTGTVLDKKGLDQDQFLNLSLWRDDLIKAKKLPESFVKKFAETTSLAVSIWGEAREANDFAMFLPSLETIVSLVKEKATYIGYTHHPYDALLDDYEKGMTTQVLDSLFDRLKKELIPLCKKHMQIKTNASFLYGQFDEKSMLDFDHLILQKMGFEKDSYRLDASKHPFCMGLHPLDIRMTTVVKTTDLFAANISSVIHEAGHGLYEQGLDKAHFGAPLCEYVSMGIHESQSKFWECFIGQSLPFWEHFYPELKKHFTQHFSSVDLKAFYKAINQVAPSMIRIYADEVTYCLHVILRYELEKGLIEGSIDCKELPRVWNEKMYQYLGITPKSYKEGCLQDIHWAWGLFGYFPTYALGTLYGAQLFYKVCEVFPDWEEKMRQGNLLFLKDWLKEHIHRHGRRFTPGELIYKATGDHLHEKHFINYLNKKYPV